jgi:hypothetical protein
MLFRRSKWCLVGLFHVFNFLIYYTLFLLLFEFSTALSCKVEQFCNKCWRIRGAPHATLFVTRAAERGPPVETACFLMPFCVRWQQHGDLALCSYRNALLKTTKSFFICATDLGICCGLFYITELRRSFPRNFLLTKSGGCFYPVIGNRV